MAVKHQASNEPHISGKLISLTDYQLWKDFRAGDLAAYSVIYRKYFFVLYSYGKRISHDHELIKDCIQDLFIKIWNNRETLADTTSIRYYLLTSLKRKLFDTLELSNRRYLSEVDITDIENMESETSSEDRDPYGQKEKVLKAVAKLSKHRQQILQKKFFENRSNQEIANEFNITVQSVYNLVFKTLHSLRKNLSMIIVALTQLFIS